MNIKLLFTSFLLIILIKSSFSQTWSVYHHPTSFRSIAIDTNNNIWSASEFGLYKFDGSNWTLYNLNNSPLPPLSYSQSYSVFVDNQSNIWVGFMDGYIIKFDGNNTWSNSTDLGSGDVKAINQDKYGNIWVGGPGMSVAKFDGVSWSYPNISFSGIYAIEVDSDNNVWIGSSNGLYKYGNDSIWSIYNTSNSGISDNWIQSIKQGTNNDLWIGTRNGINLFDKNSSWQSWNSSNSGLDDDRINSIVIDTDSIVWVANHSSSIGKYENGVWSPIFYSIFPPYVAWSTSIAIDYNGTKWVALQNGLATYDDNGSGPIQYLNIGNNEKLCQGDSTELNINIPNATCLWSDSSTSHSLNVTQAGLYWVIVNDGNYTYTDSIYINSYPNYNLYDTVSVCSNDSFVFHDGTVVYNINSPINHTSIFQSFAGCDSIITTQLNIFTIDTSITISNNTLTANSSNSTYQWLDCENNYVINNETNQSFYTNVIGYYSVVISKNGCIDTSSCKIIKESCDTSYLNELHKVVASDRLSGGKIGSNVSISNNYLITSGDNAVYFFLRDSNGVWSEIQKLVSSDLSVGDYFGTSVDIDDNYAVVGAYGEQHDTLGNNYMNFSGSAYIFKRDSNTGVWSEIQKITASDRSPNASYGYSVAIDSNTIVVGASGESKDEYGNNYFGLAGAVYIYKLNDTTGLWIETQKIVTSDRNTNDYFGRTVAIDGDQIVCGALYEDDDALGNNPITDAGSVYIFKKNSNGTWIETQKIVASDRSMNDLFGSAVSIDKNYIVVGAHQEDEDVMGLNTLNSSGSAYIYKLNNTTSLWSETQKIVASDRTENDYFGFSLSIKNDYLLVGARKAGVDTFGIGTTKDDGGAYLFYNNNNNYWSEVQAIKASDRAAFDFFGTCVFLGDDNYAVISSPAEDEDKHGNNTKNASGSGYIFKVCPDCSHNIVTINPFNPDTLCNNGPIVPLPLGTPAGGNYSGAGIFNNNFDPSLSGIGTHNIIYTYTDSNSCTSSDTTSITVELCTGIKDFPYDGIVNIYPNPNKGYFIIEKSTNINTEVYIKLLDATSKLILEKIISINNQKIEVDITNYSKGIYYIQLIIDDEIFIKQILKN